MKSDFLKNIKTELKSILGYEYIIYQSSRPINNVIVQELMISNINQPGNYLNCLLSNSIITILYTRLTRAGFVDLADPIAVFDIRDPNCGFSIEKLVEIIKDEIQ